MRGLSAFAFAFASLDAVVACDELATYECDPRPAATVEHVRLDEVPDGVLPCEKACRSSEVTACALLGEFVDAAPDLAAGGEAPDGGDAALGGDAPGIPADVGSECPARLVIDRYYYCELSVAACLFR